MATAAITRGLDWQEALETALQEAEASPAAPTDLALLFASAEYGEQQDQPFTDPK